MGKMKGKKGTPGAPLKLTPDFIKKMSDLIKIGTPPEIAAACLHVQRSTFIEWCKRGSAAETGLHRALTDTIHASVAEFESRALIRMEKASAGIPTQFERDANGTILRDAKGDPIISVPGIKADWRAEAWRLERRIPKRWGPRQTIEHVGPESDENLGELTDEQLNEKAAKIMAQLKGRNGQPTGT